MTDEHLENEKRLLAMDKKIQELRRKHGLLSGSLTSLHKCIPLSLIVSPSYGLLGHINGKTDLFVQVGRTLLSDTGRGPLKGV